MLYLAINQARPHNAVRRFEKLTLKKGASSVNFFSLTLHDVDDDDGDLREKRIRRRWGRKKSRKRQIKK